MNIIFFDSLESTNTYAKQNIDNLEDKTVIAAHTQTNGHGRFNRHWINFGRENIFMTLVLKPSGEIKETYANLTQYLSVCTCQELELLGLNPKIKWPNDIIVSNKKIAGLLAETVIKKNVLKGIALGIGLNVYASLHDTEKADQPVTALNIEGINIKKEFLMKKICERFFCEYEEFLKRGFPLVKNYYINHSFVPNPCKISVFDKTIVGNFKGFDNCGQILLEINNEIKFFNMGELI